MFYLVETQWELLINAGKLHITLNQEDYNDSKEDRMHTLSDALFHACDHDNGSEGKSFPAIKPINLFKVWDVMLPFLLEGSVDHLPWWLKGARAELDDSNTDTSTDFIIPKSWVDYVGERASIDCKVMKLNGFTWLLSFINLSGITEEEFMRTILSNYAGKMFYKKYTCSEGRYEKLVRNTKNICPLDGNYVENTYKEIVKMLNNTIMEY